jgi:hypothetical protein
MTQEQIRHAIEIGIAWGKQEADLQIERVQDEHQAKPAEWTYGCYAGDIPKDKDGERLTGYGDILDAAAWMAYDEAIALFEATR